MSKDHFHEKNFFQEKDYNFFLRLLLNISEVFAKLFSQGCQNLRCTCKLEHFDKNSPIMSGHCLTYFWHCWQFAGTMIGIFVFTFGQRVLIFLRSLMQKFLQGWRSSSVRVCIIDFIGTIFFEKNTFNIILGGNFSGFQKFFHHGSQNCIGFQVFLIGFMPISFGHHAKLYLLVCQNCTLRVHRIVFMGSIFFEKNTFPIVFHILGGNFSGFWANLVQHGGRNCIAF